MFSTLKDLDLQFFSPTTNSLPRHTRIDFAPISLLKQAGVSLWLHCNARRLIREHHLDKLNIHAGPGGVLCFRQLPVPITVTCHHTYIQQITHIPTQCWKAAFLPFERRTYRLASSIVAVSEATKKALVRHYGVAEQKITVIRNAVDLEQFHRLQTVKNPYSLLYVGRIDRRKGIDFLIRSMPLVVHQLPEARLLVAGKGAHLEKMRAMVRRLGLANNVNFLGFVPDDQLNELYNQAQCVVVPSVFEGFGITVIEALAAGTRVVGTDVDGIREILQSGDYGTMVPYGDHKALASAIVSELRAPRTVAGLGAEYRAAQFRESYIRVLEA